MAGAAMFTPFLLPHSHSPVQLIGSGPFNGADPRRQFIFSTQSPFGRHTQNASAVENYDERGEQREGGGRLRSTGVSAFGGGVVQVTRPDLQSGRYHFASVTRAEYLLCVRRGSRCKREGIRPRLQIGVSGRTG